MVKIHPCPECDAKVERYQKHCPYCATPLDWSDTIVRPAVSVTTLVDQEDEYDDDYKYTPIRTYESTSTLIEVRTPAVKKLVALLIGIMLAISFGAMTGLVDFGSVGVEAETETDPLELSFLAQVDLWIYSGSDAQMVGLPDKRLTMAGIEYIRQFLQYGPNDTMSPFTYLAIGMGVQDGNDIDNLGEEFNRGEAIVSDSQFNEYNLQLTFHAGTFNGETICEVGVFNQRTGGVLLLYQTFTGITLLQEDSLMIDVTITIGE